MNSSRNSTVVSHIKERFFQDVVNTLVMAVMIPTLLLS